MLGSSGQAVPAGRVFGIPISIHWSLLAIVVAYLIRDFALGSATGALLALLVALLTTASILFHELAHAFAASRVGCRTRAIELHAFGGLAQVVGGTSSASQAARNDIAISLAGPASNFVLYGVFTALAAAASGHTFPQWVFSTVARANLLLGAFNLVPCFPFDGGRALLGALRLKMGPVHGDRLAYTAGLYIAVPGLIVAVMTSQPLMAVFFYIAFDTCRQHRAALDLSFGSGRVVHAFTGGGPSLWDRVRAWWTPSREPRPPKLRVIKGGRFEDPPDRSARG